MLRYKIGRKPARCSRGHVLIIALALVFCLLVGVVATVGLIAQHAKSSKAERDYESALQMAEAGANAYVNMLTHGPAPSTVANYQLIPPQYTCAAVLTLQEFKTEAKNASSTIIPRSSLIAYPVGSTTQGYCAYQTGVINTGSGGDIVAFGWSNGVVRRVKVSGSVRGLFDFAAVYGLNPADAIDTRNTNVQGTLGAEGVINMRQSGTYSGPTLLAGAGIAANPNTSSLPGPVKYSSRALSIPTADQAANQWAYAGYGVTTSLGVEYFRAHNNNSTGIKYLVQDKTTRKIRELPGDAAWVPPSTSGTRVSFSTSGVPAGKTANETIYGIRVYPGDYYFTDIQHNGATLYGRNYADGSQPASDPIKVSLTPDPSSPNPGAPGRMDARFWIGDTPSATTTNIRANIVMEDPRYPNRFRIYDASTGGVETNKANLSMSILVYNRNSSGVPYGSIEVQRQSVITGSVIAWTVTASPGDGDGDGDGDGASTSISKGAADPANTDAFLFSTTSWKEFQ